MILCVFFFFKQKTAYEMRISDWSSDVCSSDLQAQLVLAELVVQGCGGVHAVVANVPVLDAAAHGQGLVEVTQGFGEIAVDRQAVGHERPGPEIEGWVIGIPEKRIGALDPGLDRKSVG